MANPVAATLKTNLGSALQPHYTFTFSLDSFRITNTRSRHEDTDYVSVTLLVKEPNGTATPKTLTKSLGNVNNGTHAIGLSFPNVAISSTQEAVFNYLIVNSGHASESQVYSVLENAGGSLATKGLVAAGAALGSLLPIPGLGTLIGAGAGYLVGELKSILGADCDGPVAAEQDTFPYTDLMAKTANGTFTHETQHPGTDSATGCGSNSMYYVTWHISRQQVGPVVKSAA